jgi:hypothetical protein
MQKINWLTTFILSAFLIVSAIAAHPVVPTVQSTAGTGATGLTVTMLPNNNTIVLSFMPAQWQKVLQYCLYQGPLSGKETKNECLPPAKLTCPAMTPPLNPASLCWVRTVPPNPGPKPRQFFFYVTTVGESIPSNEATPIQPPSTSQPAAKKKSSGT